MVSFWWMCSWSFRPCVRIWQALGGHLHNLLLMMSLDCPLAICHKKGEYIWMEIGGVFDFLELWSFRLYLGTSSCFLFFWLLMYLSLCIYFYVMYMLGGDIMFFIYVSCFTLCYIGYWFILWGYSRYMSFILCFVKSRIYFVLLVLSTHAFLCLLKCFRNIQVDSILLLSTLATDR